MADVFSNTAVLRLTEPPVLVSEFRRRLRAVLAIRHGRVPLVVTRTALTRAEMSKKDRGGDVGDSHGDESRDVVGR